MKSNSRFTWVFPISVSWIMLLFVFAPALASKANENFNWFLIKHEQVVVADNRQHQVGEQVLTEEHAAQHARRECRNDLVDSLLRSQGLPVDCLP